jgi:hypothetical protein
MSYAVTKEALLKFLPSEEEIRAACEEIQRGWTRVERTMRWAVAHSTGNLPPTGARKRASWRPPLFYVRELVA